MRLKNSKEIIRGVFFSVIFALLFWRIQNLIVLPDSNQEDSYKYITGFYSLPSNTLDAVYIGSSTAYMFFCPALAWGNYGVAMYPFASGGQPLMAARYLIEEAKKTQPEALYIINVSANSFVDEGPDIYALHRLCDYFPLSSNKFKMVFDVGRMGGYQIADRIEFLIPIIRYHSRWSKLDRNDYHRGKDYLRGNISESYLTGSFDYSSSFLISSKREDFTDTQKKYLNELFEYCKSNRINCLFVVSPIIEGNELLLGRTNSFCDMCEEMGYPVINMIEKTEEMHIDRSKDYFDMYHVNIHGSIKTTNYLLKYLVGNYGFLNKKGYSDYADWDDAYIAYSEFVKPYVSVDEWQDFNLY